MADLDKAIAAAREALAAADESLQGNAAPSAMLSEHYDACAGCADTLRDLLAALDAARGEAVARGRIDEFGELVPATVYFPTPQAPPAAPRVERYGDGVLVHWPEGVEQYVCVGDCVTGNLGAMAVPAEAQAGRAYNEKQIAWELERTALGDGFYGNALRVAKDLPGVTADDRALLDRFATGMSRSADHVALQDLAIRIYRAPAQQPAALAVPAPSSRVDDGRGDEYALPPTIRAEDFDAVEDWISENGEAWDAWQRIMPVLLQARQHAAPSVDFPKCSKCGQDSHPDDCQRPAKLEHEASADCWCEPELDSVDPDTGAKVWIHRERH